MAIKYIYSDMQNPKIHSMKHLTKIIRQVAKEAGIPPHIIKSKSRKAEHVKARKMYIERAIKKTPDLIHIMGFINRDRSSFYNYMHK